tara:strand:+ start:174 stop:590 length:417 start_codon:yes stop_codon:yes gene_type:complete
MGQTATERLNRTKSSKRVVLKTDFAGLIAGSSMFVATPKIVDDYVNQLPVGQFISMPELRADLAIEHDCDATCPLTTAIFLRLVAEAALEQLDAGAEIEDITPFWRVVAPGDQVSSRLPVNRQWLERRRSEELLLSVD